MRSATLWDRRGERQPRVASDSRRLRHDAVPRRPLSAVRADPNALAEVGLEQLADYPTILMDRNSSVRRVIEEALRAKGKSLQPAYEVAFMSTAVGFVRAGLGVSVLPTSSLEVQSAKDLVCRNLTERALTRRIGLLKRRGRSLGPSVENLAAFLTQAFKAGTAQT